jgi:hypothetical protein
MTSKVKVTKEYLISYIQTCTVGQPSEEVVEKDLAPFLTSEYTQNRAGVRQSYKQTIAHLAQVRAKISEFNFKVLDVVVDESAGTFATRFHSSPKMNDGKEVKVEIALFGNFDKEGKFTYIYELSRSLD